MGRLINFKRNFQISPFLLFLFPFDSLRIFHGKRKEKWKKHGSSYIATGRNNIKLHVCGRGREKTADM